MSNLLKAATVRPKEEKRIIDYNELIQEKLSKIQKALSSEEALAEGGFVAGLEAATVESLIDPDEEVRKAQEEAENIQMEAQKALEDANKKAAEILENAKNQAESLKEAARRQAEEEGYQEGLNRGQQEIEELKIRMEQQRKEEQASYEEQLQKLEPELVDVILNVFEKVTHVLGKEKRDTVLYLIDNALNRIESSKQFLVRVSKEDYPFVAEHREMLKEQIATSSEIEVIKDATLIRNQCLIETDGGIFDCSLDTQLENLIADIRALSV